MIYLHNADKLASPIPVLASRALPTLLIGGLSVDSASKQRIFGQKQRETEILLKQRGKGYKLYIYIYSFSSEVPKY
jgi:hypothetical protein